MENTKCHLCESTEIHNDRGDGSVPLCKKHYGMALTADTYRATVLRPQGSVSKGIVKSSRTFGTELECFAPCGINKCVAQLVAPKSFGLDSDGSISMGYANEFKSPPLHGKKGEEILAGFMTSLTGLGYMVNNSCGTHVHIGIPEIKKDTPLYNRRLKTLAVMYTIFDPVFRCLLPADRRNNRYCVATRNEYVSIDRITDRLEEKHEKADGFGEMYFESALGQSPDKDLLKLYMKSGGNGGHSRYYGINFTSMFARATLEIRYHEGTLDPVRLIHWIAVHTAIVDMCMKGHVDIDEILEYAKVKDVEKLLGSLLEILGDNIDPSTAGYTLARFADYKPLNPAHGYIPETRRDVPKVFLKPSFEDFSGMSTGIYDD